ncbi:MAG TPA: metallophosphoesterase [Bacteroidales bacterium]|nr:metallophosphoesterase [Bacteroidales bacterium]
MMKKTGYLFLLVAIVFIIEACNSNDVDIVPNPFDNISENSSNERDKIVVISDLHMGNDLSYSENVKHLQRLEQFLNEVRSSATIKELVIGGDMFDEWYVPTRVDAYGGGSQADFVRKTVAANQVIFDVLNGIIKDGKIKLTYVPGNHDMGFTPENVNIAMPGVNQARDAGNKYAVGTYYPNDYPEIAIEHGHRYDFFCCATPNANEAEAPGATLPPGYFFARIAANSFTDPTTLEAATKAPEVKLNTLTDAEQYSKYVYYNVWKKVLDSVVYVKDNFSDPIIKTNVGNYTKTYAINDILPYNSSTDGSIKMNLYNGLFTQENWNERQTYNNVPFENEINGAIVGSLKTEFIDEQSNEQYFQNPDSEVRIVVFGHTHNPMIKSYTNFRGETCIYANSGTWEDQKTRDKNAAIDQDILKMDFIIIDPVRSDKKKLQVTLYQYNKGTHLLKDSKEVDL